VGRGGGERRELAAAGERERSAGVVDASFGTTSGELPVLSLARLEGAVDKGGALV
jgi:hypothetical protein